MSELKRLGVHHEPLSSLDGVEMTPAEHERFSKMADSTSFVTEMTKMDTYKTMNDKRKKVALELVVEHFLSTAEKRARTDPEFKDLRERIRRKAAADRRGVGATAMTPHIAPGVPSGPLGE